jgi:hypothetical protein
MTTFAAHGEYTLRRCGRVVRVDAWGPWNVERTTDYAQRLKMCMEAMPKPFGIMAILHLQPILSPEAEAVLRANIRQRVLLGCAAQATVFLDPLTLFLAQPQYRHMYVLEGLRHAIFYAVAPAAQWLIDCGFTDVKGMRREDDANDLQQVAQLG